ncbi:hypothetical protein L1D15_00195 [Vibrio sp. Isolate25]|uniref:hypothetical protein n=1 Tax=Vibrio sp. Isolate25 TaxID=2908535 RepID=UPI001EFD7D54|nr:hypothetical protein [Vibrio sp. Isolate25]MCG9595130.1 hypothetical protein [Vibrio sp. Isolate25]
MLKKTPIAVAIFASMAILSGCNDSETEVENLSGRWTTGDLHIHSIQSDDAQRNLEDVLNHSFENYGLDWAILTNHLRMSQRDHAGEDIPEGPIPFSLGMEKFEVPFTQFSQLMGHYPGKTIFSAFEWDMPAHEHFNIAILGDEPQSPESLKAIQQFEYYFTEQPASAFDLQDVLEWEEQGDRANKTHDDALTALAWLQEHYPTSSFGMINHPSRYNDNYVISDFREFHDTAPDVVFALEGMMGGQMEPDRGSYAEPYNDSNLPYRSYGGADFIIAEVGGQWDALLGEGRRIWNFANSDYHFKTDHGEYSSGYRPGEYAKTHLWIPDAAEQGIKGILEALRSGRSFSTYGDLIDALSFNAMHDREVAYMGGDLSVNQGDEVTITIRFKSPETNNYEEEVGSNEPAGMKPVVHHVDLIAGDVYPRAKPGTPEYDQAVNPSTQVIARFTQDDWTVDSEGYATMTFSFTAEEDQYFRLRGTNLAPNTPHETDEFGNPLPDEHIDISDPQSEFNAINDRNYYDLWFYSNPIFVSVSK